MAIAPRVNPTLFDKLVGGVELEGLASPDAGGHFDRHTMATYFLPKMERFNEEALRLTVRRDLAWLLNTTNLEATVDLAPYPQVRTSVLNYGVPDLSGRATSRRAIQQRAREIRGAIQAFEPRFDGRSLMVEPTETPERDHTITFVIHGDVRSSVRALPVKFRTDVETDNAAVSVRD